MKSIAVQSQPSECMTPLAKRGSFYRAVACERVHSSGRATADAALSLDARYTLVRGVLAVKLGFGSVLTPTASIN